MKIPRSHHEQSDVAMTPMIDVVFLLLIFFVCTASFEIVEEILPSSLLIAAGQGTDAEVEPELDLERIVVKIAWTGEEVRWIVNERPYSTLSDVRKVLAAIAEIDPSVPVVLDVEGDVPLGRAIDLYDICRIVGFAKIQFAASVDI